MATSLYLDQAQEQPNLDLNHHANPDEPAHSTLFDNDQQQEEARQQSEVLPPETSESMDPDDLLTIQMTTLFLVLFVLYVGFFAYRWRKVSAQELREWLHVGCVILAEEQWKTIRKGELARL